MKANHQSENKMMMEKPETPKTPSPFSLFQREFDEMVRSFFEERWPTSVWENSRTGHFPQLNFVEKENKYLVEIDLPGIDPKEVDLTLQDNTLSIKGERKMETETSKYNFHRIEKAHGQFLRTIAFPLKVDQESVSAEYKNGVLKISVKKTKEAIEKSKKIEIKCN